MRRPAALFPITLALGAIIVVPQASAREPTPIKACQTISQPGSYELANNLTATGDCLVITANFVTIDLAGFSISGLGGFSTQGTGIGAGSQAGIAVRNGSISGFKFGVDLSEASGSIVEGLRVSGTFAFGIGANGIVKGNVLSGNVGVGIDATGTVTGNNASNNEHGGIVAGPGSTLIGNTATNNSRPGIIVNCPSNVIDNTAINNLFPNISLVGEGCHSEDNVAP